MSNKVDWRRARKFKSSESIADERASRDAMDRRAARTLRKWSREWRAPKMSAADRKLLGLDA